MAELPKVQFMPAPASEVTSKNPTEQAAASAEDPAIHTLIGRSEMSRFQIAAIAICVALNMLDGFDVLVVAFTAPSIAADWNLPGQALGVLLSAGLLGMSIGSLLLAPLGDRFGRRPIILTSLSLMSVGMLLSSSAPDVHTLAAWRVVTGIGIGGMLAAMNVITAEYASNRWRSTAISAQATGYPIGATLGGVIAAVLIARLGWRSVYLFGSALSVLMIPIVLRGLPESMDFLLSKQPRGALSKINGLLRRMGHRPVHVLPARPQAQAKGSRAALRRLLSGANAPLTIGSWSAFFFVMMAFYFVLSWTPKLLVAAGMTAEQGITGGVLLNLGGIFGGLLFGALSSRFALKRVILGCLWATCGLLLLFGLLATHLVPALLIAAALGSSVFGCMIGLYALAPLLYDPATRSTGMGWAIGMGRIGGIGAPAIAGVLVDAGWKSGELYFLFALPLLLAAFVVRSLRSDLADHVQR